MLHPPMSTIYLKFMYFIMGRAKISQSQRVCGKSLMTVLQTGSLVLKNAIGNLVVVFPSLFPH